MAPNKSAVRGKGDGDDQQQQAKISDTFKQQTRAKRSSGVTRTKDEEEKRRKVVENGADAVIEIDEQQQQQQKKKKLLTRLNTEDPELVDKAASILDARIIEPIHTGTLSSAEVILRDFDMTYKYGPCVGITRMQRYDRADKLGLHPPVEVYKILATRQGRTVLAESVFHGNV